MKKRFITFLLIFSLLFVLVPVYTAVGSEGSQAVKAGNIKAQLADKFDQLKKLKAELKDLQAKIREMKETGKVELAGIKEKLKAMDPAERKEERKKIAAEIKSKVKSIKEQRQKILSEIKAVKKDIQAERAKIKAAVKAEKKAKKKT